jgi:hypothetical protein
MKAKLRSRDGFGQNPNRVWGHCEQPEVHVLGTIDCPNSTMYRCDLCKQFICAEHQREHLKTDHEMEVA